MALTPLRWLAAAVAGSLVLAVVILRDPISLTPSVEQSREQSLAWRNDATSRRVHAQVRQLSTARLVDSVLPIAARTAAAPVRVFRDRSIPAQFGPSLDTLVARLTSGVGTRPRVGVDVFLVYDTSSTVRGASTLRYGVTLDYVLPTRDGERCSVILPFPRYPRPAELIAGFFRQERFAHQVVGPCAYYAAFGLPGAPIDQWLRRRGWALAGDGSWSQAATQLDFERFAYYDVMVKAQPLIGLGATSEGIRCAAGDLDSCEGALLKPVGPNLTTLDGRTLIGYSRQSSSESGLNFGRGAFGWRENRMLADMVRTMGRDRFAAFWTSNEPVPVAFEKASGIRLDKWAAQWAGEQYGTVVRGPRADGWSLGVAAILVALSVFIGIRVSAGRQFA